VASLQQCRRGEGDAAAGASIPDAPSIRYCSAAPGRAAGHDAKLNALPASWEVATREPSGGPQRLLQQPTRTHTKLSVLGPDRDEHPDRVEVREFRPGGEDLTERGQEEVEDDERDDQQDHARVTLPRRGGSHRFLDAHGSDGIETGVVGPTPGRTRRRPGSVAFPMRFGLLPPCEGRFLSLPRAGLGVRPGRREAGFESIWVFEHAVIPAGYSVPGIVQPEGGHDRGRRRPRTPIALLGSSPA